MRSGAEFGWRALVGWIHSYGMLAQQPLDFYELLPDGFGVMFATLGKRDQSPEETEAALARMDDCAELIAKNGAEYFVVNSSPMVTYGGPGADRKIIGRIESLTGKTGTTTTTAAVRALQALGIKKIALCSPYVSQNPPLKRFLEAEGLEIVGERGLSDDLTRIHRLPTEVSYRLGRDAYWESDGAEALYMAGGRLRVAEVLEDLEADIGVPVIASTQATAWELLHYFGATSPIHNRGMLLREMPAPVPR